MKKLVIQKGFYYGAGSKYGWNLDNYHIHGVGISKDILTSGPEIEVEVAGRNYIVNTEDAINFIKRYRSFYQIRGTTIGVISRDLMKEIE